ncbi:ABC transporter ATP-binding protein [Paenibacillus polysaccharolyticus]|uniref:ABC transporter ATP-binding protein n=1 Tax=Paenibacillus polysaccharolyticus TaxID=582692 RepID=UPI00203EBF41|nr:ABC transporter ATP-binding protein [Paenibacillus polysaccharolyticus]MCM3133513.1 ABC transporter ATP-binding protein [Paenibacillus polysaccharolyticus]
MANLLEIKNIRKSYGGKDALKNVSFNVPPGSIVGFIGDNGAGKSTTFKIVLGLISKDAGTVNVFGQENMNKHPEIKERIGVVFDAANLPAHLTIKQLNKVFGQIFKSWDENNFQRLVQVFSLPTDKKVNEFSRGMSMKLSVAVALSHHAELLILDEATGGLDPSSREEMLEELKRFVSDGVGGIVLSSHIMSDIEKIASHLVIIKEGEILLNEEKAKVFEQYAIVDLPEEQLRSLDQEIVVAKRNRDSYYSVLVSDKQQLPSDMVTTPITMDMISLLLTRSQE